MAFIYLSLLSMDGYEMRKHGTSEDRNAAVVWIRAARQILKTQRHDKGIYRVSVNDLVELLELGQLEAPPKPSSPNSDRGAVMKNVFTNVSYYRNTGIEVKSTFPASKGRKVALFEYLPELDDETTEAVENWGVFDTSEWL
jgi:hypothetical protein